MAKKSKKKKATKKRAPAKRRPPIPISPGAYAGARGISRQAVMRAIASGRLAKAATKNERGWWRIDPEVADAEWSCNTDPRKQRDEKGGPVPKAEATPPLPGMEEDPKRTAARLNHAQASAERVTVQAQLAHLTLRERLQELVEASVVRTEYFRLARRLRDRIMGIPDRIAAVIAAETDQRKVHHALVEALTGALQELSAEEPAAPAEE